MTDRLYNPPLFQLESTTNGDLAQFTDVSLRDLFAAAALTRYIGVFLTSEEIARACYNAADAMLAEREKREK